MKQFHNLYAKILAEGVVIEGDRTGIGTRSIFGHQMRFDLRKGFPLLGTKFTSFKVAANELLWMIRGDTNENWLRERGVTIWKEWADENGDLFDIYGKQMRRMEVATPQWKVIKRRSPQDDGRPLGVVLHYDLVDPNDVTNRGKLTGEIHVNGHGHKFVVLDSLGERRYKVQFVATGAFAEIDSSNVRAGNVKDPLYPEVYGVGYMGTQKNPNDTDKRRRAKRMWKAMLGRCYSQSHASYVKYGAEGVTVCRRWHCFSAYYADLSTLPGYENWLREPTKYALDKDYYGSMQYGPKTCVFISREINGIISNGKPVTYGAEVFPTMKLCAEALDVPYETLKSWLQGALKTTTYDKVKSVAYLPMANDEVYRPVMWFDQLTTTIEQLRKSPKARRHIISMWNSADMMPGEEKAALSACHAFVQFYARPLGEPGLNGEEYGISCHLYQRSADAFLGVPYNCAFYSLLTHMIAHLTNMVPEEFIWTGGDTHLYLNHDDHARRFLKRSENLPLPTLKIKRKVESIDDFALDDFEVIGYRHLGKIAAPVAV